MKPARSAQAVTAMAQLRGVWVRLRWGLGRGKVLLGWEGMAGTALIVACAATWMTNLRPLEARIAADRVQAAAQHDAARARTADRDRHDPVRQLQAFYAFFGRDDTLESWLDKLHEIGTREGLLLQSAEYRAADMQGLKLGRYEIVLPVTATYPQLKRFVAGILAEIPIASLDEVSIRKRKLGDAFVDAQLQLTLYLAP